MPRVKRSLLVTACAFTGLAAVGLSRADPGTPQSANGTPPVDSGAVSGAVIDAESGQPLPGVLVYLEGRPGKMGQLTDSKGRFVFDSVPADDGYRLSAVKSGYFDVHSAGASTGTGNGRSPRIVVPAGAWLRDLRLRLRRAGAISGFVLDVEGQPIVNAHVRSFVEARIAGRTHLVLGPLARTDDRGAYRLARLPRGTYYVQVPSVQEAAPVESSSAQLAGATAETASAAASRGRPVAFGDHLMPMAAGSTAVVGRYPVPPRGADGRLPVFRSTFFPTAATRAEAVPIVLEAGEQREGVDVVVPAVPGARVAGRIDGPVTSFAGLVVRLVTAGAESLGIGAETATALMAPDGRFAFANVPAGAYTLDVRGTTAAYVASNRVADLPLHPGGAFRSSYVILSGPDSAVVRTYTTNASGYWGRERLQTNGHDDVTGLVIQMHKGGSISGRIAWDTAPRSLPGGVSLINAEPARGDATLGVIGSRADPDDPQRFRLEGFVPGDYVLSAAPLLTAQGIALKSIQCGGVDLMHRAINPAVSGDRQDCVVAFTAEASRISGRVRGAESTDLTAVAVLAFPIEQEQWEAIGLSPARFKLARPVAGSSYELDGLPAGEYYVVATTIEPLDGWPDPAGLSDLAARAVRVHTDWGRMAVADVPVARERSR